MKVNFKRGGEQLNESEKKAAINRIIFSVIIGILLPTFIGYTLFGEELFSHRHIVFSVIGGVVMFLANYLPYEVTFQK